MAGAPGHAHLSRPVCCYNLKHTLSLHPSQGLITSLTSNNSNSPWLPGSALCLISLPVPAAYLGSRKLSIRSLPVGQAGYLLSAPASWIFIKGVCGPPLSLLQVVVAFNGIRQGK